MQVFMISFIRFGQRWFQCAGVSSSKRSSHKISQVNVLAISHGVINDDASGLTKIWSTNFITYFVQMYEVMFIIDL
jgi:hypothetical protein